MEAGNATPIRPQSSNDADQVAKHPEPLTWKPFHSIDYPSKHISRDGVKHGESHAGEATSRLEDHSSGCGSKSLGFSELEHATDVDIVVK